MITAKPLPLPLSPPTRNAGPSWWLRFAAAMKAVWRLRLRPSSAASRTPADRAVLSLPVAGKIAAITVTGSLPRPARNGVPGATALAVPKHITPRAAAAARRPGVQGRWKTSDRVPML